MSEILKLPVGWLNIPMQEAVLNANGARKPVSLKLRAEIQGYYPYYGATGQIDSLNDFTHEGEHVLIGEDGANLLSKTKDLAFIVEGQFWVNNHAHAVKCLADMPSKFVAGYVNSLDLTPYVTGSAQPKLTKGNLEKIPFPLPPLAEQKVIAEKLDKLLAKVDSIKARLDAVPDTLKRFRQSVLAAAVSGKLTEEWRSKRAFEELKVSISEVNEKRKQAWIDEQVKTAVRKGVSYKIEQIAKKYKEPTEQALDEFDLTLIKHIPDEWLSTNLDSVSVAVTGKTPKTTEESYWNGDIPFISPSQITNDGRITSPERHVTQEGTSKTTILPSGSIMIVCIGTIGKVGLVDKEVAFNQQINALIPTQAVLPKFLFFWSKTLHSWLNKTSSAVVNAAIINKSRLCSAPCPLPSIAEQTEIVRRVEKLFAYADKVEAEVNAAQERVNKLTQSILAKAFRGELTDKWREQNPELISDENSAEALLEKIKNEREKLKPTKKRKVK